MNKSNFDQLQTDVLTSIAAIRAGRFDETVWLEAFPILKQAKACEQSPLYHAEGDVWTHTVMCLHALVAEPGFTVQSITGQIALFLAMLLHDVSKAATSSVDPRTGQISHPGHSAKGAIASRVLLWEKSCPFQIREQVCQIIAHHQVPFFAINGTTVFKEPVYLARVLSQRVRLDWLCQVARADILGRICPDQQKVLDDIALFEELAREEGCLDKPRCFASPATRVHYANGTQCHPDYALFEGQGSKVWVLCGPPASGKDTWISKNAAHLPIVSFDDAKAELGLRHGQNDGMAAHYAVDKAKTLLREKKEFVFNATHLSKQMRSKTLDLIHRYQGKSHLVYLEAEKDVLLTRNAKRDNTLTNKGLLSMLWKWETPTSEEAHCVDFQLNAKGKEAC